MPLPTTSNVTRPKALGYDVRIESNYYRLIPPLSITDETAQNPMGQQLIRNPEDIALISEDALPLSQTDFSGGEGLDFAHRPDNTDFDKTRFWSSKSVDVITGHGDVQKLELTNTFSKIANVSDFATVHRQSPQMVEAGGSLFSIGYQATPSAITRIDDPAGTPSTTSEDPLGGSTSDLNSIAEVDDEVYVSIEGYGIRKRDTAGTWSDLSTIQWPYRLWGLKGRVVGADLTNGRRLASYDTSAGTKTDLVSINASESFLCATDAGAAILAGATNGYVYALADVDGTLTLRAQTPFRGEEVTAIGAGPSGIVLIGTRDGAKTRIYMGELGSSYTIQNTQLLREWDFDITSNSDHAPISHITFSRDNAFFAFEEVGGDVELWKFDVTTTGLFHVASIADENMSSIVTVDDKMFFTSFFHDVYGEDDTYQSSGYLISPLFDHFTAEDKVWAAAKFFGVNFPANTSAELFYSTNPAAIEDDGHASWTSIKSLDSTSGTDDSEALISNATGRWITFKIELATTDSSSTPQVRGYSSRAYAGAGDTTIPLTINCSDRLERRGRKAKNIPGLGKLIYNELKTLEGSGVEVELLWNDEVFEGTVRSVSNRTPVITSRGSQLLASQVEFVGRRQ